MRDGEAQRWRCHLTSGLLLSSLVVSEITRAFVLLIERRTADSCSFALLNGVDSAGINPHGVITMEIGVPLRRLS